MAKYFAPGDDFFGNYTLAATDLHPLPIIKNISSPALFASQELTFSRGFICSSLSFLHFRGLPSEIKIVLSRWLRSSSKVTRASSKETFIFFVLTACSVGLISLGGFSGNSDTVGTPGPGRRRRYLEPERNCSWWRLDLDFFQLRVFLEPL